MKLSTTKVYNQLLDGVALVQFLSVYLLFLFIWLYGSCKNGFPLAFTGKMLYWFGEEEIFSILFFYANLFIASWINRYNYNGFWITPSALFSLCSLTDKNQNKCV